MLVLVEAVSELVVAIPVVRGAAFGADDDIVRTLKPLVAYGAVVLRKLHINLRTYSHTSYYNKFYRQMQQYLTDKEILILVYKFYLFWYNI